MAAAEGGVACPESAGVKVRLARDGSAEALERAALNWQPMDHRSHLVQPERLHEHLDSALLRLLALAVFRHPELPG